MAYRAVEWKDLDKNVRKGLELAAIRLMVTDQLWEEGMEKGEQRPDSYEAQETLTAKLLQSAGLETEKFSNVSPMAANRTLQKMADFLQRDPVMTPAQAYARFALQVQREIGQYAETAGAISAAWKTDNLLPENHALLQLPRADIITLGQNLDRLEAAVKGEILAHPQRAQKALQKQRKNTPDNRQR